LNEIQRNIIFDFVQCDVCSVISSSTVHLYLQHINIKANEVRKIAKSVFGYCMYFIGVHLSDYSLLK